MASRGVGLACRNAGRSDVLQFTDISRPSIHDKAIEEPLGQLKTLPLVLAATPLEEEPGQFGNVFASFTQTWQTEWNSVLGGSKGPRGMYRFRPFRSGCGASPQQL